MVSTSADIGSPSLLTNIDTSSIRRLFIAGALCVTALLVAIIVGATGPAVYESKLYNLYQCPNNSHIYTSNCQGMQLVSNNYWDQEISGLSTLNNFWALQVTPYSNNLTQFTSELITFQVIITASTANGMIPIISKNVTQEVVCNSGFDRCNTFTLIDEENIDYVYYDVNIAIISGNNNTNTFKNIDASGTSTSSTSGNSGSSSSSTEVPQTIIGDIDFVFWKDASSFSNFEIGVHLTLLIISCIAIVGFLFVMRKYSLINWSFEQKFLFAMFFSLILSNNPFYGIQYATQGAFFPFLNAFFSILFLSVFALYSLLVLDRMRLESKKFEWDFSTISKIVVVLLFAILGVVLFSWINVRDRKDPIIGYATSENGIQALFYLVATIFICILLWTLLLVITTFPIAYNRQFAFAKYLFTSIPIVVYVFSVLIGIFAGTFGPLNSNSLSITYFNVLNNVFTAIVAYSYWPSANPFHKGVKGTGEEERLVFQDDEEI